MSNLPEKKLENSWSFEDSAPEKYSEREFYTRSTGAFGHKESIRIQMPPEIMGRIGEMVARREIKEYRTSHDFIRDAIIHNLVRVNRMIDNDDILKTLNRQIDLELLERVKSDYEAERSYLADLRDTLEKLNYSKDQSLIEITLNQAEDTASRTREPYRTEILSTVVSYRNRIV